jgi:hypothetical protein
VPSFDIPLQSFLRPPCLLTVIQYVTIFIHFLNQMKQQKTKNKYQQRAA